MTKFTMDASREPKRVPRREPRKEPATPQEPSVPPAPLVPQPHPTKGNFWGQAKRVSLRLVAFVVIAGWLFYAGLLVGRGTAPVNFHVDELRSQLVTASSTIAESVATMGVDQEDIGFYDNLGKSGTDTHLDEAKTTRRNYAVAPNGVNDSGDYDSQQDDDDGLTFVGVTKAPEVTKQVYGEALTEIAEDPTPAVMPEIAPEIAPTIAPEIVPDSVAASTPETLPEGRDSVDDAISRIRQSQGTSSQPAPSQQTPALAPQAAPPQTAVKGSFSVQVLAVRNESEAINFLQGLVNKGFSGRVEKTEVGGGTWYRVRVGVYQDRVAAEKDLQKLIKSGVRSPMIVTTQ